MSGIETGIDILENIFFNSTFAGQSWLIYLIIIFGSMLIITRNWSDWGELALPVMVGWRYFGMPVPTMFLIIGGITFVISLLTMKAITGSLSTIGTRIGSTMRAERKYRRELPYTNVKEAMRMVQLEKDKYNLGMQSIKNRMKRERERETERIIRERERIPMSIKSEPRIKMTGKAKDLAKKKEQGITYYYSGKSKYTKERSEE